MNVTAKTPLIYGMLRLVTAAMKWGPRDDAAVVIRSLRAARPDLAHICLMEGQLAASSGRFRDAIRLLRDIESSPTHWSDAKALIASCQILVGDRDWEITVNDILTSQNASPEALATAKRLKDSQPIMKGDAEAPTTATATTASAKSEMPEWMKFDAGYIRG